MRTHEWLYGLISYLRFQAYAVDIYSPRKTACFTLYIYIHRGAKMKKGKERALNIELLCMCVTIQQTHDENFHLHPTKKEKINHPPLNIK